VNIPDPEYLERHKPGYRETSLASEGKALRGEGTPSGETPTSDAKDDDAARAVATARTCLKCGNRSVVPHGDGWRCRDCGADEPMGAMRRFLAWLTKPRSPAAVVAQNRRRVDRLESKRRRRV
jgi:hypothetical protein